MVWFLFFLGFSICVLQNCLLLRIVCGFCVVLRVLKFLLEILAKELTVRVHSQAAFESVKKVSAIVFSKDLTKEFLNSLSKEDFELLQRELPNFVVTNELKIKGITIDELLADKHETIKSKSDVRRAVQSGALFVNTEKVQAHDQMIGKENLIHGKYILFQNGKKHKFLGVVEG